MTAPVDAARVATADSSFHSGGHTCNLPTGISAGDLLIVARADNGGATGISWPAGWTQINPGAGGIGTWASGAITFGGEIRYRIADGTEGSSISVSTTSSSGLVFLAWRITGHDPNFWPVVFTEGVTSGNPDPPYLMPYQWVNATLDTLWLAIGAEDAGNQSGTPSGYSNVFQAGQGGAGVSLRGGSKQSTDDDEDPGAFTAGSSSGSVWSATIAIKPANQNSDIDTGPFDRGTGQPWHNNANMTTHIAYIPDYAVPGDLVIIGAAVGWSSTAASITTPTGWTSFAGPTTSGQSKLYHFYRVLDGSEGTRPGRSVSLTITGGDIGGAAGATWCKVIKGHDPAVPPEGTTASGTSTTPDPPSHSPSWGTNAGTLIIASCEARLGTSARSLTGTPSGYAKVANTYAERNISNGVGVRAASLHVGAVSSENPGAFTSPSVAWAAATIAVKGGSGGIPPARKQVWVG